MARKTSTIDLLPADIKAKLQELLRDPRATQLAATAKINAILAADGHEERVSKSAVNRYAQRMEEIGAEIRESREMAEMWIGQLGATPQGVVGNFINETLRTLALDVSLIVKKGSNARNTPKTVKMLNTLALSMQRLEQAATINVKREGEIKKQVIQDAVKAVDEVAGRRKGGLSDEAANEIRRKILGIGA